MNNRRLQAPEKEIERIIDFIRSYVYEGERVVVPVSGGLDSDIVARLCHKAIGKERIKLFIVAQSEMESKFLYNARSLAEELEVPLAEIHLENMNMELIGALECAEEEKIFQTCSMLDPAKAKGSVRSSVLSCYQDKGFLIAGTTNRTEKELGFFLTFGDNLAHFKPIAHLYKSELTDIAECLGTNKTVIEQESSAGFWEGQTDTEDLAYWIINRGPIVFPRQFTQEECLQADKIAEILTPEAIDKVLESYSENGDASEIIESTSLTEDVVYGLIQVVERAKVLKNRELMVEMSGCYGE